MLQENFLELLKTPDENFSKGVEFMFQKLFLWLAIMFFIFGNSTALAQEEFDEDFQSKPIDRERIAVIIDTPAGSHAEPEAIYKAARSLMGEILKNKDQFYILPLENVDAYVQIYREEHDLDVPVSDAVSNSGVKPALKRANLLELGNFLKSKYIVYIRITTGAPSRTTSIVESARRMNVSTDFRIWSQEKRNFIYAKRYQLTGVSKSYFSILGGSSYHAAGKGTNKAFSVIRSDMDLLREMIN